MSSLTHVLANTNTCGWPTRPHKLPQYMHSLTCCRHTVHPTVPVVICLCKCNKPRFITRKREKGNEWSVLFPVFSFSPSQGSMILSTLSPFPTAGVMGSINHPIFDLWPHFLFFSLQTALRSQTTYTLPLSFLWGQAFLTKLWCAFFINPICAVHLLLILFNVKC